MDEVDRDIQRRHQGDGAQERDGDAERDPTREPQLEKQSQDQNHQDKTVAPVSEHQIQTALEDSCLVLPDGELDPLGDGLTSRLQILLDHTRHRERALVADSEYLDQNGRLAVEAGPTLGVGKAVDDVGHITDG
jgi:hypothetical protein